MATKLQVGIKALIERNGKYLFLRRSEESRLRLRGLTMEQIRIVQQEKRKKRGGFAERILLLSNGAK